MPVFIFLIFIVVFTVIVIFVELVITWCCKFSWSKHLRLRKAFYDVISIEYVSATFTRLCIDSIPLFLFTKQFQVMLMFQFSEFYTLLLLKYHNLDLLYKFRLCLVYRYKLSHIQMYAFEE